MGRAPLPTAPPPDIGGSTPMPAAVSQASRERTPVMFNGQRVSGLFARVLADGTISYTWSRRVDGRMRRGVLQTTGRVGQEQKTDAVNEYRKLFVAVAEGDVKIGARSLTVTALVEDFLARERGVLAD